MSLRVCRVEMRSLIGKQDQQHPCQSLSLVFVIHTDVSPEKDEEKFSVSMRM